MNWTLALEAPESRKNSWGSAVNGTTVLVHATSADGAAAWPLWPPLGLLKGALGGWLLLPLGSWLLRASDALRARQSRMTWPLFLQE